MSCFNCLSETAKLVRFIARRTSTWHATAAALVEHGSSWILQLALISFIDRPGMGPPGWWEAKFDMKTSCREHLFHSAVAKSLSVGFPPGCHVLPFLLHQRHGPPPHGYLSRAEISTNLWVSRLQKLDPMSQPGRLLTWVLHLPT